MDIEFTEFTGKAPRLEAVQVTAENVEALAVWMGADVYSVSKTLVGGERKVSFQKVIKRSETAYPDRNEHILFTRIGDWVVKIPDQVLVEGTCIYEASERYNSYTQEQIDRFVTQQHDTGEVDLNKE